MVIGQGHRQWIETELHQADQKADTEQQAEEYLRQCRQRQGSKQQQDRAAANQAHAVMPIGKPAQRPLHQQAGENAAAHEQAHLLGRQAHPCGVQRRQTIERADQQTGHRDGGQRQRHTTEEETQLQRRRVQGGRVQAPGQRHRHQAQREAQRHQHQQLQPQRRVYDQSQLAKDQSQIGGRHVATEHQAPLLGFGLLVEPTLDDHVLAHHAQAHQHAQEQPERQPLHQSVAEHRCGNHPRAGHVGTDVPYPTDQPMPQLATQHQAEIVGRHQCSDPQTIHGIGQTQGQIGTEQTGTEQHQQSGKVQRAE